MTRYRLSIDIQIETTEKPSLPLETELVKAVSNAIRLNPKVSEFNQSNGARKITGYVVNFPVLIDR